MVDDLVRTRSTSRFAKAVDFMIEGKEQRQGAPTLRRRCWYRVLMFSMVLFLGSSVRNVTPAACLRRESPGERRPALVYSTTRQPLPHGVSRRQLVAQQVN